MRSTIHRTLTCFCDANTNSLVNAPFLTAILSIASVHCPKLSRLRWSIVVDGKQTAIRMTIMVAIGCPLIMFQKLNEMFDVRVKKENNSSYLYSN